MLYLEKFWLVSLGVILGGGVYQLKFFVLIIKLLGNFGYLEKWILEGDGYIYGFELFVVFLFNRGF